MTRLDVREKAERIVELFRGRRPIEILPADLYPENLDEAYAIRRVFQEIEEKKGRSAIAGYKIGLTTPACRSFVASANLATVQSSRARFITAAPNWQPWNTATSGSKPRLPFG